MATGAKHPVVLGKMTQNGATAQRKATANGNGAANGAMNGATHNGSGTAIHKVKTTRVQKVTRAATPSKVKAAAR
jgi:hypothetical protein